MGTTLERGKLTPHLPWLRSTDPAGISHKFSFTGLDLFELQIIGLLSQHTPEMTSRLELTSLRKVTNLLEYLETDRLHSSGKATVVLMAPVGTPNTKVPK